MKEEVWLASTDPKKLLKYLHRHAGERKRRLFAVACCYRIWHLLAEERSQHALRTAEDYADGSVLPERLSWAENIAHEAYITCRERGTAAGLAGCNAVYAATVAGENIGWDIAECAASEATAALVAAAEKEQRKAVRAAQPAVYLALVREIFGNPFRPVAIAPEWLTSDVLALATGTYDERAFDRLPILADALQDAGCDSDDLMNHLRDPNATHVRGCWALDLILGKK
jgi:hypothetical protein